MPGRVAPLGSTTPLTAVLTGAVIAACTEACGRAVFHTERSSIAPMKGCG